MSFRRDFDSWGRALLRRVPRIASCVLPGMLAAAPAMAFELEPNEFVTAPPGTVALLGYFIYGDHESYRAIGGPTIHHDTSFDDFVGIGRAAYYFDLAGTESLVEVLQPFGSYTNAEIGGTHFSDSGGAGDTTIAAAVWPINDAASKTYLGVALYVTLPDGAYDALKTVNLGGNRMVYDPEIALHKGFDERWSVDLTGDVIAYGDNTQAGVDGRQTLSQDPTIQLQGFLNYTWESGITTSLGYEGEFAGRRTLEGTGNGSKTEFQELRFVGSYFLTSSFQVLGEINHQVESEGGFRQDLGVTMRVLYVF